MPTVPLASGEAVLIVRAGGAIVIEKLRLAVTFRLSRTVALKLKVPAVEGVPEIEPLLERVSPAGGDPDH